MEDKTVPCAYCGSPMEYDETGRIYWCPCCGGMIVESEVNG